MLVEKRKARRIAVISGKGGVGKTVITANLAAAMASAGRRVLVVDADLGLANLDVILGVFPKYTIQDIFRGSQSLENVLMPTEKGFDILPAGSGLPEGTTLTPALARDIESILKSADNLYDEILFDAGAGIGDVVLFFACMADDILLVATPEPTSMMDSYATIKTLKKLHGRSEFLLVVNQANPANPSQSGAMVARHLQNVASKFIESKDRIPVHIQLACAIPQDPAIPDSIQHRQLLAEISPQAPSTYVMNYLADFLRSRMAGAASSAPHEPEAIQ